MMSALKAADPVRDHVVPYDEALLLSIVAQPRPAPAKRRRRKLVIAAWLSAVIVPIAGVGVAGAAGLIPDARAAFGWTSGPDFGKVDLATAARVFVEPGPSGTRFEVWTAKASGHELCIGIGFPPVSGSSGVPLARTFEGGCGSVGTGPLGFASSGTGGGGTRLPTTYALSAGRAVRAELRFGGRSTPLVIQHGWIAGWFPVGVKTAGATVIGYAADGSVVGRDDISMDPPP